MLKLDRAAALKICKNLSNFHSQLISLYEKQGISLTDDLGRRNILMSGPMEYFFAQGLEGLGHSVIADGRTGKADIVVKNPGGEDLEIECKLTSPHKGSGSISFQTDYETLSRKGKLDYVYLVADADFKAFCFLYFEGLTIDDFRKLSPGARGKVQMYKYKGMKKARVLVGEAINRESKQVERLEKVLANLFDEEQTSFVIDKVYKVNEKIKVVKRRNASYKFILEDV